jgi:hypothetical protein
MDRIGSSKRLRKKLSEGILGVHKLTDDYVKASKYGQVIW